MNAFYRIVGGGLILGAVLLAFPADPAAKRITNYSSGDWVGGAYVSNKTSRFTHCTLAARYKTGIGLGFTITRNYNLLLVLLKRKWELEKGATYEVGVEIDNHALGRFSATATAPQTLVITFGNTPANFQALRRGYLLRILAKRKTLYFSLKGTAKALNRTRECVDTALGKPASTFSTSTFSTKTLKSILAQAGLKAPRFVAPRDALRKTGVSHQWREGGIIGMYSSSNAGSTARNRGALDRLLSGVGESCKGKFGSRSFKARMAGDYAVRKGEGTCEEPQGTDITYANAIYSENFAGIFTHFAIGRDTARASEIADRLHQVLIGFGKSRAARN